MKISKITFAVWLAYGHMLIQPAGAYRLMRFKRKSDGKEGFATVGPDKWGRWNP